jgi:transglutaminase-like putative cysteine protease
MVIPASGQVDLENRTVGESVFSKVTKLAYEAFGDPELALLNLPAESRKGGGKAVLQKYALLLERVGESVARLHEYQKLTPYEESKLLVNLAHDGEDLIEAGKAVAGHFDKEMTEMEASAVAPVFIERHQAAMEAQAANQETLDSLLERFDFSFTKKLFEERRETLELLHDWFLIYPVKARSRLSVTDNPEIPPFHYKLAEVRDLAEVGLDDRGFAIPKSAKGKKGVKGTKDLKPASGTPTVADLGTSVETKRTPEIEDLAASLDNSAIKIFNWVRKNIEFDAYVGSRRGAAETLRLKAGNDTDQASLLIALLRSAGIPCRYATGKSEISAEAAVNWTGAGSARAAGSLLTTAGMEGVTIYDGNEVKSVQLRRVWVEAFVPYSNYRGSGSKSGEKLWVPLDPAFKKYQNEPGVDVVTDGALAVDVLLTQYFASDTPSSILDAVESVISPFLEELETPTNVEENRYKREIVEGELPWLPASLPGHLLSIDERFSKVALNDIYQVRFNISGEGSTLDHTVLLPEIAGKQVTLSYRGSTADDRNLITANKGLLGIASPWLIKVVPELRVDGCVVATGTGEVTLGLQQSSQFFFREPGDNGMTDSISNTIVAGRYEGLAIGTGRILVDTANPDLACPEDQTGTFQHTLGMHYLELNDQADRRLAGNIQAVLWKGVSNAILGQQVQVAYSGGVPLTFDYGGLFVDADRAGATPFSAKGDEIFYSYGRLRGAQSSQNENLIFEHFLGKNAVSTIKILRVASMLGVPVLTIDASNAATQLGRLTHPFSTRNDISNQVSSGRIVTIPKDPITYFDWSGTGYIQLDPTNGTGGYIISGGLSGGATAEDEEEKPGCEQVVSTDVSPPEPPGGYSNCDKGPITIKVVLRGYDSECEVVGTRTVEKKIDPSTMAPGIYPFKFGSAGDCGCSVKTVSIKIKTTEKSFVDTNSRLAINGLLELAAVGSENVTAKSPGEPNARWAAGNGVAPATGVGQEFVFNADIKGSIAAFPLAPLPVPAAVHMIFPPPSGYIKATDSPDDCGSETEVLGFPSNKFSISRNLRKQKVIDDAAEAYENHEIALDGLNNIFNIITAIDESAAAVKTLSDTFRSPFTPKFDYGGSISLSDQIKEVPGSNRVEWVGTLGINGEVSFGGSIPIASTAALGIPPPLAEATIFIPVKLFAAGQVTGDLIYRRGTGWLPVQLPKAEISGGLSIGIGARASVLGGAVSIEASGTTGAVIKIPIVPVLSGKNLKLTYAITYEIGGLTLNYKVGAAWGLWETSDSWTVFGPWTFPTDQPVFDDIFDVTFD